jgi:RNA-directed DNA polymerase
MMNERGKSDRPVVPVKFLNKAGQPVAEGMEGRGLTKGNLQQQNASRTQSRSNAPSALERIRQAASKDKEMRFTALFHHICAPEALRTAYPQFEARSRARRGRRDVAALRRGA